jgi:hypothetical protein
MLIARARVATERPARYGKQLCEHLGRRLQTSWDGAHGEIPFADGSARCELDIDGDSLVLTAHGRDAAALAAVQDVAGRHLERFGARSELAVRWEPAGGTEERTGPLGSARAGLTGLSGRIRRRLGR